jgi:hypothetical protein
VEYLLGSLNAQAQDPDDPLSLRAYIEILWASFHDQDRQCDPYIFAEYFHHYRQEPSRLPTTQDSLYLSLQQVSQNRTQELFARHLTRPYQGVSRIVFLCVFFGFQLLGKAWFVFIVVDLDVLGSLRRSFSTILVAPPYLFLRIFPSLFPFGDLPKWHMWGVFHIRYIGFS